MALLHPNIISAVALAAGTVRPCLPYPLIFEMRYRTGS